MMFAESIGNDFNIPAFAIRVEVVLSSIGVKVGCCRRKLILLSNGIDIILTSLVFLL